MSELIEVKNLKKYFPVRKGLFGKKHFVHAVDDITFSIKQGECFGLVGESGCGKSTLSRTILRSYNPTEGTITFSNKDLFSLNKQDEKQSRKDIQMVFQDPYWSVNPKMTIGSIIEEPIVTHLKLTKKEREAEAKRLLHEVGLSPDFYSRYPHQLSGGQRQRVGIARAIALNPKLIILDEPTSALDMSVQAQILNLLKDLQRSKGFTYLFISHDLSVIKHMCSRLAVMYLGEIVEMGEASKIFKKPEHPYTKLLFNSLPTLEQTDFTLSMFEGEMPKAIDPPKGCRFASRCKYAVDACSKKQELFFINEESSHQVRCHLLK
ncbi:ABC transporter ATP-binding protein [Mesobacillus harenae]|uniref:ABC transporter ATP-binding protein n=1 Tax=Mesobacillus harenae TaxID=2213203 RepID=UPI0015811549|nr:ABC transporter ATP-binding protein [Mesobacillus harenae]